MDYAVLKQVHVACALLSYVGLFARGVWMIRDSAMLGQRWVRIVPHVNDTILLAAAITLAVIIRQYPLADGWLTAKVIGLVVYILLGMAALRPGRTKAARVAAWIGAQAVFIYIVAVAYTRNPGILL